MTEIMTFNGVGMSQYFRITDIIRPIGNKRTVSTDTSPFLGVNIQEIKIGAKEHKIKFDIKGKSEIEKLYLRLLLVTDYIWGMTDSYAKRLYQELNAIV